MYTLLARIPEGLEPLRKKFEEHVKRAGMAAIEKLTSGKGSAVAAPAAAAAAGGDDAGGDDEEEASSSKSTIVSLPQLSSSFESRDLAISNEPR